jgi:HSP20 family protein
MPGETFCQHQFLRGFVSFDVTLDAPMISCDSNTLAYWLNEYRQKKKNPTKQQDIIQEARAMLVRVERYPLVPSLFDQMVRFDKDFDEVFNGFLGRSASTSIHQYPAIDMAEYESEFIVVAELPGVSKEDVKLSLEDGVLTISGRRKSVQIPEKSSWVRNEISTGEFVRTISLPREVKSDAISAELANGVLKIVLPKAEEVQPREISIR